MPYNYPYYQELLEQNGLTAVMTLYSYLFKDDDLPKELSAKSPLLENRLKERGIVIRPVNLENFGQEITRLHPVYNEANTGNWGFLPLDETSFFHMAKDLKKLVKAEHVWIAEKESKIIGYAVAVPDYNQVFRKIPRGRLFPFGWYNLLTGQPQIKGIRIMILGVLPAYRGLGIDWCLYAKIAAYALKTKMKWGEACYVMEQNVPMNRMLKTLGAEIVKEYKLYETETKRQTI
jgi:GNAT superfamily N-acetyltransferase